MEIGRFGRKGHDIRLTRGLPPLRGGKTEGIIASGSSGSNEKNVVPPSIVFNPTQEPPKIGAQPALEPRSNPKEQMGIIPMQEGREIKPHIDLPAHKEWQETERLISDFADGIRKSETFSLPGDVAMGKAISRMIETIGKNDRMAAAFKDFDFIEKKSTGEGLSPSELTDHFTALKDQYGLTDEEVNYMAQTVALSKRGYDTRPRNQLSSFWTANPEEKKTKLYHFSEMTLGRKEGNVYVKLEPVYDGGIDSVAYPLNSLFVVTSKGKPIETNFANRLDVNLGNIGIKKHPEVLDALKEQFAKIVDRYVDNDDGFLRERTQDGREDSTQLNDFLYDYLENTYLRNKLDRPTYQSFRDTLKNISGDNTTAAVRLKVIMKELFDPEASQTMNDSYLTEHNAREIEMLTTGAQRVIKDIGGTFTQDGEGLENYAEIVNKLLSDRKSSKKVNQFWKDMSAIGSWYLERKHLYTWESMYKGGLNLSIFQRALEIADGQVFDEPHGDMFLGSLYAKK